jgi:hypothetical protein
LLTIFAKQYSNIMKLKDEVIERIRAKDEIGLRIRTRLSLVLKRSVYQIMRYLEENSDNLTKAAALDVIREETGLSDDQILESNMVESKID